MGWLVLGLLVFGPAVAGYKLPPRARIPLLSVSGVVCLGLWTTYDGAFHNNPWPFLASVIVLGLLIGSTVRALRLRLS